MMRRNARAKAMVLPYNRYSNISKEQSKFVSVNLLEHAEYFDAICKRLNVSRSSLARLLIVDGLTREANIEGMVQKARSIDETRA